MEYVSLHKIFNPVTKYYGLFPDILNLICGLPQSQTKTDFESWILDFIFMKCFQTRYNFLPYSSCVLLQKKVQTICLTSLMEPEEISV